MADLQLRNDRPLAKELTLGPPSRTVRRLVTIPVGVLLGVGLGSLNGLLIGAGVGLLVAYAIGWTTVGLRRFKRFAIENNLALAALGRGELAKAHEVFLRWATTSYVGIRAMAHHNLAWTLMLEGRVADAATLFEDTAENYERSLASLLPTTRLDAALCYALLGELEKAETWRAKSEEPVKAPPRPTFGGMKVLLGAILECRKGNAASASVALEHGWAEHEAVMTGETLRIMRVVRAFACALEGPRNQGVAERILGDLKPRYESEFAFLGSAWPEMSAFLAARNLAG